MPDSLSNNFASEIEAPIGDHDVESYCVPCIAMKMSRFLERSRLLLDLRSPHTALPSRSGSSPDRHTNEHPPTQEYYRQQILRQERGMNCMPTGSV